MTLQPHESFVSPAPGSGRPDLSFPAANAVIEGVTPIDGGCEMALRPDQRNGSERWFWWHVGWRADGPQRLRLRFAEPNCLTSLGAVWTADDGATWRRVLPDAGPGESLTIDLPAAGVYRMALAVPYLRRDLLAWLERRQGQGLLRHDVIAASRKGRPLDRLIVGRDDAPHRVSVACRHHACECMASFAVEGLLDAWLDEPALAWLRSHAAAWVVPLVDIDGVEDGDSGKARRPHDHNRDYQERLYPETQAIASQLPAWAGEAWRIALDLHCPWIRGQHNEHVYLVDGPEPAIAQRNLEFARQIEAADDSGLAYRADQTLAWGVAWNTAPVERVTSHSRWSATMPGIWVAASMEIPYAIANAQEVTPDRCRRLGRALALAIQQTLQKG